MVVSDADDDWIDNTMDDAIVKRQLHPVYLTLQDPTTPCIFLNLLPGMSKMT
jgi:hypothetical protein